MKKIAYLKSMNKFDEVDRQTLVIIFSEIKKNLEKAKKFKIKEDIFLYIDFALSDVDKGLSLLEKLKK